MGADPSLYSKKREDKHCSHSESKQYLSCESKSANSSRRVLTSRAFEPENETGYWTPRAPDASCCKDAIKEYSGTVNGAYGTSWQLTRWNAEVELCETDRALLSPVAWGTVVSARPSGEFLFSCGTVKRKQTAGRIAMNAGSRWTALNIRGEERRLTISERKALNITLLSLSNLISQSLPLCSANFLVVVLAQRNRVRFVVFNGQLTGLRRICGPNLAVTFL